MTRTSLSRGFGAKPPHPATLDAAILHLSSLKAIKVDCDEEFPALKPGTFWWSFSEQHREALIGCEGESWVLNLTICNCGNCTGILRWECKAYAEHDAEGGIFTAGDGDSWPGIRKALRNSHDFWSLGRDILGRFGTRSELGLREG